MNITCNHHSHRLARTPARPPADVTRPTPILDSAPDFAKGVIASLKQNQMPAGIEQKALTAEGQDQAKKGLVAASFFSSNDEVAGKDEAMGDPGKVVQNGMTEYFTRKGKNEMEAILITPKTPAYGLPGVMYVNLDANGIQYYGIADKGNGQVDVQGTFMKPTGPNQFDGYTLVGSTNS